jgi:predicted ribonuclease YlaK
MVKHIIITNRDNKALVFKSEEMKNNKYVEFKDNSTTMASLNAVIDVLENIPEDSEDLHIVLLPKCLGLMLKMDNPAHIRDNGYKTDKGTSLTEEFVDLMCYANELRAWLTTGVVRFKIQGSQLLYKNEIEMINAAWKITDKVVKPNYTGKQRQQAGQKVSRPTGAVRPTRPANVKSTSTTTVQEDQAEYTYEKVDLKDIRF